MEKVKMTNMCMIVNNTIKEVQEETGLTVSDLQFFEIKEYKL